MSHVSIVWVSARDATMVKVMHTHTHTHTHTHNTHTHTLSLSLSETFYPIPTINLSFIFEQLMNFQFQSCKLSTDSTVVTRSMLPVGQFRAQIWQVQEISYPLQCPDRVWGPARLAIKGYRIFLGSKRPRFRSWPSPAFSSRVKN
jgi:hypothetical protein